ncbi:MAG: hypothetical protein J6X78_11470 [Treponema sp.]|nr:hypothetical protein [Treponema sp.]
MKKIFKLFGILLAIGTILCLASCDGLLNMMLDNEEDKDQTPEGIAYTQADSTINHEFYLSDDMNSYIYYTSTQSFNYGNHQDCIYQISFTPKNSAASKGTWKLFTRPKATTKTIEMIYQGTFEGVNNGSVRNGGTVQLKIGNDVIETLNIEMKSVTTSSGATLDAYACIVNVAASHTAIGATDSK